MAPPGKRPTDPDQLLAQLELSEARYADLVRRAGYATYQTSASYTRFTSVDPVLARMLGYDDPVELFALNPAGDVHADPAELDRLISRPLANAVPEWVSTRWKRRDGSVLNVRLSLHPFLDAQDQVVRWEGLVQDDTERQRNEELRRRSERMASIGTTLAGVAHELNNPLAAIMGFAQLLLKKAWPPEDRAALETINHEAIRSATIVRDLLAMARRRDVERRVRTDVNDIVAYVARTRRYALETAGVTCRLVLDPAIPPVLGDRAQLEQVFLNLLNNAEFALTRDEQGASGGHIDLRTDHDERDVIVQVADDGPGIPEDVQSRIWDPFWTTKDEGDGTGLGLAVVHGLIADHGGTITLDTSTGKGARFVIRLPIAKDSPPPETATHARRPLDVLVVDPGASDLLFVERFLTSRGHAVINAASGELALRLAEQAAFDAVVCDAQLLGRDGRPVADSLRASPGCAGARFVLSIQASANGQAPAAFDGAAFVVRPYDVEELRRFIEGD